MNDSKLEHRMDLLLWRHADAEDGAPDSSRALTRKGLQQAAHIAKWLKPRLPREYRILASPAKRAQQTASALELPYATERRVGLQANVADIIAATAWPDGKAAVIVVGHQPTLGQLAALLLSGVEADWTIKKGALWWFSNRARGEQAQIVLRAVISPDLT